MIFIFQFFYVLRPFHFFAEIIVWLTKKCLKNARCSIKVEHDVETWNHRKNTDVDSD